MPETQLLDQHQPGTQAAVATKQPCTHASQAVKTLNRRGHQFQVKTPKTTLNNNQHSPSATT
jgi:hypothetical protein